ncbi:MAG: site-2 protease family protein [Bacilli bacterium]|nr:site-2 protease family protein [Bacilli bacterium]
MITLIIFLIILGLIVFIHEFGHFIFAKKAGIHVFEFSLGFGPKIFSFRRKNDETEYMIKLIPLGGYVALAGETYDEEDEELKKIPEEKRLYNKSFLRQLSVMVAGVFNNFVLGIFLLFIIGLIYGSTFSSNELFNMKKNYPLYEAGARNGQKVIEINNKKVKDFDDIQTRIAIAGEKATLNVKVKDKNNEIKTYKIKPKYDKKSKTYFYGISVKTKQEKGFVNAIKYAFAKFISIYKSLIVIIISLFTGKLGVDSLSGPVGIYTVVGVAKTSMYSLLYLTAYLSINVGFMNILPFPAFDGGRAFLLIVEKIIRKKVPLKVETIINNIGFILLMALMVFVTIKDVFKLF